MLISDDLRRLDLTLNLSLDFYVISISDIYANPKYQHNNPSKFIAIISRTADYIKTITH